MGGFWLVPAPVARMAFAPFPDPLHVMRASEVADILWFFEPSALAVRLAGLPAWWLFAELLAVAVPGVGNKIFLAVLALTLHGPWRHRLAPPRPMSALERGKKRKKIQEEDGKKTGRKDIYLNGLEEDTKKTGRKRPYTFIPPNLAHFQVAAGSRAESWPGAALSRIAVASFCKHSRGKHAEIIR